MDSRKFHPPISSAYQWDYLVLTASNTRQAQAYEIQLNRRQELGLLPQVRRWLVVPDPDGKRVGSGGSTQHCLQEILNCELPNPNHSPGPKPAAEIILDGLRILIVHAGGDSRRLPPYGPCGKIFMPLPGDTDTALPLTTFDRLLPVYLGLPRRPNSRGQLIVTTGDVLLRFDPSDATFRATGVTGLGCRTSPEISKNHGVFCPDRAGSVRRFLQKPTVEEQKQSGALDASGKSLLDIGVLSFDPPSAARLLSLVSSQDAKSGKFLWRGPLAEEVFEKGCDLFLEILCSAGTETSFSLYENAVRRSGSNLSGSALRTIFEAINPVHVFANIVAPCEFQHFGNLSELVQSGLKVDRLSPEDNHAEEPHSLEINNRLGQDGRISGSRSWVEGCTLDAPLILGGGNVVAGVPVNAELTLPQDVCLDVLPGWNSVGDPVWFVRCYGRKDTFKTSDWEEAVFCGRPLPEWMAAAGAGESDLWSEDVSPDNRSLWTARLFPAVKDPEEFRSWLWMFELEKTSPSNRTSWLDADRYSLADQANLVDLETFLSLRQKNRAAYLLNNFSRYYDLKSEFSAADLAFILQHVDDKTRLNWLTELLNKIYHYHLTDTLEGKERLLVSRLLHSLGTALLTTSRTLPDIEIQGLTGLETRLDESVREWLINLDPDLDPGRPLQAWAEAAQKAAFRNLSATIVLTSGGTAPPPKNALRSDEIIWGRAPARLDLGGGWTDTPPYALEYGGRVINAAVDLNGQPPIHVYARVLEEPEIRINSIDHSRRLVVNTLDELLDYRTAASEFGLAKAALVLTGFAKDTTAWPSSVRSLEEMLDFFGGGIELTTLAAIPSGSGLGTSSIMGAVIFSVLHRLIGRTATERELFYQVLRLEQALTTGGGWQDQIGGTCPGVKVITARPGLIPDPEILPVKADILDPQSNGGQTLLYYTGLRRLAKNILRHVVGHYLDRNRLSMATLRALYDAPPGAAAAMEAEDLEAFGRWIDRGWELNKAIDPDSTASEIEDILERVRPQVFGAKLLGAGGGGFLLLICRSPEAAEAVRRDLEADPPNSRARFFDFSISREGLVVTTC